MKNNENNVKNKLNTKTVLRRTLWNPFAFI